MGHGPELHGHRVLWQAIVDTMSVDPVAETAVEPETPSTAAEAEAEAEPEATGGETEAAEAGEAPKAESVMEEVIAGPYRSGQSLDGEGTLKFLSGNQYSGTLRGAMMNGQGSYTWPSLGIRYDGEFVANALRGGGRLMADQFADRNMPLETPLDIKLGLTAAADSAHPLRWGFLTAGRICKDMAQAITIAQSRGCGAELAAVAARKLEDAEAFAAGETERAYRQVVVVVRLFFCTLIDYLRSQCHRARCGQGVWRQLSIPSNLQRPGH